MSVRFTELDITAYNARRKSDCRAEDADLSHFDGKEAELHRLILDECARRRFYVVHSRCDRSTTQQKGVPDMLVAMPDGKTLWIEVKVGKNKLTAEQNVTRHVLAALDHKFYVVRSLNEFLTIIGNL